MTDRPAITLVVSLYRSGRHLERFQHYVRAAADALSEAGVGLQLVVVANEPTAHESFRIARLARRISSLDGAGVDVLRVPRETLYCSWNRGVAAARGECIGFWNCDDIRNPLALLEGLDAVRRGAGVVYWRWVEYERPRRLSPGESLFRFHAVPSFERALFRRSMCAGPFFLLSRPTWRRVGPFDPQFKIAGDFDWCARAADKVSFVLGREVGGVFLRHSNTLSGGGDQRQVAENNIVYLRSGAYGKLEPVSSSVMRGYRVDTPWRHYDVPDEVLDYVFGGVGASAERRDAGVC